MKLQQFPIFWSASTVPSLASRLQSRNLASSGMLAAKAVQRQVAIVTIIAVKIGASLAAVELIVGSIKIHHDCRLQLNHRLDHFWARFLQLNRL